MRHLAQQIECVAVRLIKVNPQIVQRHEGVVSEAATPLGAATSPRPPTAFLANVTALLVKREIFDMNYRRFPASSSKFYRSKPTPSSDSPEPGVVNVGWVLSVDLP
jgi:hypothetical protein